jgi:hypothetical protein
LKVPKYFLAPIKPQQTLFHIVLLFCYYYYFFSLVIYSYVHTLFGPFLPSAPCLLPLPHTPLLLSRTCSALFSNFVEDISNNEKNKAFFSSWDKDSYTERFLALLLCTSVLQPKWIHLYLTSSPLPGHLPILTSVALRLLYCYYFIGIFCHRNM